MIHCYKGEITIGVDKGLEDIKELVPMEVYHYLKEKIDGLEKRP